MPASSTADAAPPKSVWRQLPAAALWAATLVVGLFTIAGFGARYWWRCEQLCHFRVQYFWLLAASTIVYLIARQRRRTLFVGLLAAVNAAAIFPLYLPNTRIQCHDNRAAELVPLRLMAFNVHSANRRRAEVLAYVRDKRPDVAIFLEVSTEWTSAIETLAPDYPYRHIVPRRDNFGIAIISRQPWARVETAVMGAADLPSVVARFQIGQGAWTIIGTHPLPPASQPTAAARNEQLSALAEFARRQQGPLIVAGDLNVTSWSPYFSDLVRDANLCDSRQGRGVQPSWTSRIPLTDLPIDHVLVSPGIVVERRMVGPHLGSDHRPVVADLLLPKQ
jgi:endonuclease/exonuclease/phosphatase (EEP) superfamily protein YafD